MAVRLTAISEILTLQEAALMQVHVYTHSTYIYNMRTYIYTM